MNDWLWPTNTVRISATCNRCGDNFGKSGENFSIRRLISLESCLYTVVCWRRFALTPLEHLCSLSSTICTHSRSTICKYRRQRHKTAHLSSPCKTPDNCSLVWVGPSLRVTRWQLARVSLSWWMIGHKRQHCKHVAADTPYNPAGWLAG